MKTYFELQGEIASLQHDRDMWRAWWKDMLDDRDMWHAWWKDVSERAKQETYKLQKECDSLLTEIDRLQTDRAWLEFKLKNAEKCHAQSLEVNVNLREELNLVKTLVKWLVSNWPAG